jgi:hypothetical protein
MFTLMNGLTVLVAASAALGPAKKVPPAANAPAVLMVDNTQNAPVVVYLDQGPFDTRIGTVAANSVESLTIPKYLAMGEDADIFVRTQKGEDLSAEDVVVNPHATLDVLVPTNPLGYVPPPPPPMIANPGLGSTTVTVENHRTEPVSVYVQYGVLDRRLGVVAANQKTTLAVPAWIAKERPDVQIFIHPENGEDLASGHFDLTKGNHLLVKVPRR